MSEERLSEEHMALLERALGNVENDYRPTCISANYGNGCPGSTDESTEFWRRAVDAVPALLAEVRHLRAALRLSNGDRDTLECLHDYLSHKAMDEGDPTGHLQDWIAALSRLVEERGA